MQDTLESPCEHRCPHCCFFAKSATGLKTHIRRCKSIPGSRTGQRSEKQVRHRRRKDAWKRQDSVEMGNAKLPNCYHFPYLGVQYCGDGNTRFNLETRQAIAASRFRSLKTTKPARSSPLMAYSRLTSKALEQPSSSDETTSLHGPPGYATQRYCLP